MNMSKSAQAVIICPKMASSPSGSSSVAFLRRLKNSLTVEPLLIICRVRGTSEWAVRGPRAEGLKENNRKKKGKEV